MTLVPTGMSSVVAFWSWLIYVTRGMVLLVLVEAWR
jgi:Na+-transporting methylmalonyl-CoA/oxaloacetate decarboxylase gamma subunit